MNNFLIGIAASITGAILAYFFKENIENLIYLVFRKLYPRVEGKWKLYSYRINYGSTIYKLDEDAIIDFLNEQELSEDEILDILAEKNIYDDNSIFEDLDSEEIVEVFEESSIHNIVEIKQLANKVKGEINSYENGKNIEKIKISGKITPTRIMILSAEEKTEGCHNFGTFLVKLSMNSKYMSGYQTFLCTRCESTTYSNVLFEKI